MATRSERPQLQKNMLRARRKAVSISSHGLVTTRPWEPGKGLPLVIQPTTPKADLCSWAAQHRDFIGRELQRHGGLLFRGFGPRPPEELERFVNAAVDGEPLDYMYRTSPRTRVSGKVFTSTEYAAALPIPLHSENAYARAWPMKLVFMCLRPAERGGATPLADSRRVFARIDPAIRDRFRDKQIMYLRNYRAAPGFGLSWREAFQTGDRRKVEAYCRETGIEFEWLPGDGLRTRQICPGWAHHPVTGEAVWFNQAHLFHPSNLEAEIGETMVADLGQQGLSRNAFYGDGSVIDVADLDHVRAALAAESVVFPWERGDVLMLDNMLALHGRQPYEGPREIVLAMAESFGGGG